MAIESRNENPSEKLVSDNNDILTAKKRRKTVTAGRTLIAATIASGAALGLSACGEAGPQELEVEYSVGNVLLSPELAESRHNVLELCNTGEGAKETAQLWTDYGYEERSGMKFFDAFKYMGDMKYDSDPNIVAEVGAYTYPVIELLAEDCLDATVLVSKSYFETTYAENASKVLDEFNNDQQRDPVLPLATIFESIKAAEI